MLDIKLLRNNFDEVEKALASRNEDFDLSKFKEIDEKRRQLLAEVEKLKAEQNAVSKQVPIMKKEGKDVASVLEEMKVLSEKVKELTSEVSAVEKELNNYLLTIPNIPNPSVPKGSTDEDNVEIRKFGDPTKFEFEPKAHWDLGSNLGVIDAETAAKVSGSRFTFYKGAGARLERAIMNFFLDTHTEKHGYTEVFPPFMVSRESMTGTGQLPKFEEDAYKVLGDGKEYFLVPTAEVPVTNMYREQILDGSQLPILHCAYTACFRAEAGSAGRDTRGLIRQHQFNKVELVKFTKPEDSYEELEKLTKDAEEVLQLLNLPYRVVKICIGDLGFTAAMKYDIEVWMPSYNRYVEISSCSNFEEFQSRRANIKYKDNIKDKAKYVHTLNGSGVAIGRTTAAILENYQQADGSVKIPEVLVPYMGGLTEIK
ncbi:serine--tRNA ligase [Candidatus Galacturonibacter soehngenii]|uniref:Serine--tRNA ligase n=1 Tax=Candidatus Galacturonatibacter soehngenii TaxID=2307010 RepID=A0A7V7UAV1_9FIRM|nr:serine--tRNA ligase [Candidatus Galacturonibacter soehngenii]KAB1435682.1 serine--tRNA ligase [Candidatus Galacturonibacter soehngenii]MBA4688353.1 serine--tRNA ligase [Candidatus Galacturonibacter soehngenii]